MKLTRQIQLISVFLIAILFWTGHTGVNAQIIKQDELDTFFLRLQNEQGFSGAVLIADSDGIVLHKGYGLADDAEGTPLKADTVLVMGSISKQLTAAGIMHLEAQGKLSVYDPISKFFPNAPADKADITLHQLLIHSAGFTNEHFEDDLEPMTKKEALAAIFALELGFEPGTQYEYSNTGYTFLAAVIEEASGQSYTSYLHDNFFTPLGMNRTGFFNDDWEGLPVANGYWFGIDNGKPSGFPGPYWGIMGNGGIMSTVEDLYIWWQALDKNTVLPPAQTGKLFTPYIPEDSEETSFYGYGWVLAETDLGSIITHDGAGLGGNSDLAVYPDKDLIMIIMSNRIIKRALFNIIPLGICFPATEAREQLESNINSGDFSQLPTASFNIKPYFLGATCIITLLTGIAFFNIKRLRSRTTA